MPGLPPYRRYAAAPSLGALALALSIPAPYLAAQPVVQQVPNSEGLNLNAALARLGRNPRDVDALIAAGHAALTIGDIDASIGFFTRADQVTPNNPRVRAGLARAMVRSANPFDAFALFDEAERAGILDAQLLADRGLAYDLVGDNTNAQRFYRQALASGPNDEVTRRLALSLAMAGDKRGSADTLAPLLQRQDKAAWRTRAFALAVQGQVEDAIGIANAALPSELAAGIAPYLRYMPRLTPAQQAAAANFGQFPRASEIGQDDPRVALYAPRASASRRTQVASADSNLIPKGQPLGNASRTSRREAERAERERRRTAREAEREAERRQASRSSSSSRQARAAPPDVQPGRSDTVQPLLSARGTATPLPTPRPSPRPSPAPTPPPRVAVASQPPQPTPAAIASPAPAPVPAPAPSPSPVARVAVATPPPAPTPTPAPSPARIAVATPLPGPAAAPPGFDLARASPAPAAVPSPAPEPARVAAPSPAPPAPPPSPPRRQSLAEAFGDFSTVQRDTAPASGAVDMRRIRPARESTETRTTAGRNASPAKPPPPSHPSRIWVQLGIGRDKTALGFDWRRIARLAESQFRNKRPSVSAWNQTNRLLAGPFESEAAANAFIAQLRRANVTGAFVWTSPAGQVVDALPLR